MQISESIEKKLGKLAGDHFTGETVLRFLGSNFETVHVMPRDFKKDDRSEQDIGTVVGVFNLCREFGAFGSITLIWNNGSIKNYTVKLTFQGNAALFQTKAIFRNTPSC